MVNKLLLHHSLEVCFLRAEILGHHYSTNLKALFKSCFAYFLRKSQMFIYMVGSSSFGYFGDRYDHLAIIYNKFRYGYQYENFIVWRVK